MYGWRARIGLMIAHSNTVAEPEFNKVVPAGVSVHASRVPITAATVDGLRDASAGLKRAVGDLSAIDAAVYAYATTAMQFVQGPDADLEQMRLIEELTGRPAIPAATAVTEALHTLGVRRIAVGTPYVGDVNEAEERFLAAHGFEVANLRSLDLGAARRAHDPLASTPVSPVGLQPPEVAYRLGRSAFVPGVDAVFISACGLRTLEVIAPLEADLGVPVVTSGQALIWAALQLAGVGDPIAGYGRLFAGPSPFRSWRHRRIVAR